MYQGDTLQTILHDSAIAGYEISKLSNSRNHSFTGDQGRREHGIIDVLQPSYGFISCSNNASNGTANKHTERRRLFFHRSSFRDKFEDLAVGEKVEFQEDIRDGRPVAVCVFRSQNNENWCVSSTVQEGRVIKLCRSLKDQKNNRNGVVNQNCLGTIGCVSNSEHFYYNFSNGDVQDGVKLKENDIVNFLLAHDSLLNSYKATNVCKVADNSRVRGVVNSLKDTYGFIERADKVKEIYFNYSEFRAIEDIELGCEVEFTVRQTRKNKEEAVNITVLPRGTVVFQDIYPDLHHGVVTRVFSAKDAPSNPLNGRIAWTDAMGSYTELAMGELDLSGRYTLLPGDQVQFKLAVDRRDKLRRATQVDLVPEANFAAEQRSRGMIVSVDEGKGTGVISPDLVLTNGDEGEKAVGELTFKLTELVDWTLPVRKFQPVSYTLLLSPVPTSPTDTSAPLTVIRVVRLPDTSAFSDWSIWTDPPVLRGLVQQGTEEDVLMVNGNAIPPAPPLRFGIVVYRAPDQTPGGRRAVICFEADTVAPDSQPPRKGDVVEFCVAESRRSGTRVAFNVRTCGPITGIGSGATSILSPTTPVTPCCPVIPASVQTPDSVSSSGRGGQHAGRSSGRASRPKSMGSAATMMASELMPSQSRSQGWICGVKESCYLIETANHRHVLIAYHPRSSGCSLLGVGSEVSFLWLRNNELPSPARTSIVEEVRALPVGTIAAAANERLSTSGLIGRVVRAANLSADDCHGLIEESQSGKSYPYTPMSLVNLEPVSCWPHLNDKVAFSLASGPANGGGDRAVQVTVLRRVQTARVSAVQSTYGLLDYAIPEGNKPDVGLTTGTNSESQSPLGPRDLPFLPSSSGVRVGDTIRFYLEINPDSGLCSAVDVATLDSNGGGGANPSQSTPSAPRPSRLQLRRLAGDEPRRSRVIHLREPRGPDANGNGFATPRCSDCHLQIAT